MKLALTLIALSLIGCGLPPPDPHPNLTIDDRLPAAEVLAGIDDLVTVTDGGFLPKSIQFVALSQWRERANVRLVPSGDRAAGTYVWSWSTSGVRRWIEVADLGYGVRRTIAHELIHWAGLPEHADHSADGVFAAVGPADDLCITQETVDDLCDVIECGAEARGSCDDEEK